MRKRWEEGKEAGRKAEVNEDGGGSEGSGRMGAAGVREKGEIL